MLAGGAGTALQIFLSNISANSAGDQNALQPARKSKLALFCLSACVDLGKYRIYPHGSGQGAKRIG